MLANQTSGYPDYETTRRGSGVHRRSVHIWTFEERMKYASARPYNSLRAQTELLAHQLMILGRSFRMATNRWTYSARKGVGPMGLEEHHRLADFRDPTRSCTRSIPSAELPLKIPSDIAFYEESTFWNPQWGTPIGANQTTTIDDMATTAVRSAPVHCCRV